MWRGWSRPNPDPNPDPDPDPNPNPNPNQALPHRQPGEALTHALRFAELLSKQPSPTLAAGEAHTLFVDEHGTLHSCGGDYVDDDQSQPFLGHLGHGSEWGEAVMQPTPVKLPAGVQAHAVCGGGYISLCISTAREAWRRTNGTGSAHRQRATRRT